MPIGVLISFVIAFVLAFLIARRASSKPVFTTPRCAKCDYDLRAMNFVSQDISICPECGAKLDVPGAVNFGRIVRPKSRWGIVGGALGLIGLLLVIAIFFARTTGGRAIGPTASAGKTNPQLIAALPTSIDQPWDWQELNRRLRAGNLSNAEVDGAVGALATHLQQQTAKGKSIGHLPWIDGFFTAAFAKNAISPPVATSLCQAFYEPKLNLVMRRRVRAGSELMLNLDLQSWDIPSLRCCWALKEIRLADGTIVPVKSVDNSDRASVEQGALSGSRNAADRRLSIPAPPVGEQELSLIFDMGAVDEKTIFRGMDGRPGPRALWPSPVATWQTTIKRKLTVVPADQSIVGLVTDPAKDPNPSLGISVAQALVRPASGGLELVLQWKYSAGHLTPVCYKVTAIAGEQKINVGQFILVSTGNSRTSSTSDRARMKSLPPEIKTIDLLLTPDPTRAEPMLEIEEIWGRELKIEGIPLDRADLTP